MNQKSHLEFNAVTRSCAIYCIASRPPKVSDPWAIEKVVDKPYSRQLSRMLDWHILQLDRLGAAGIEALVQGGVR